MDEKTRIQDILSRKEIIFLHIGKTGGSSFWHSFANELKNNSTYAITDAYHQSTLDFNSPAHQTAALEKIMGLFVKTDLKKLFVHYHSEVGNIKELLPSCGYILIYRNPEDRMKSGFRHWYSIQSAERKTNVNNFHKAFFSLGLDKVVSGSLGFHEQEEQPSKEFITFFQSNILAVHFNDFIGNSDIMHTISETLGIGNIKPIHVEETITDKSMGEVLETAKKNNPEFLSEWNKRVEREKVWFQALGLRLN